MIRNSRPAKRRAMMVSAIVMTCACAIFAGRLLAGGVEKTGGPYSISNDSITIAGTEVTGSTYVLLYSAGQVFGTPADASENVLKGGVYKLESGFISGIEGVFNITKTVLQQQAPTANGYTGAATDIVPGSTITYKLYFENTGDEPAYSTLIEDPLPSTVDYASGTISLTLDNTTTAQTDALDVTDSCSFTATDSIHCLLSNLNAGATGTVIYSVIVR